MTTSDSAFETPPPEDEPPFEEEDEILGLGFHSIEAYGWVRGEGGWVFMPQNHCSDCDVKTSEDECWVCGEPF